MVYECCCADISQEEWQKKMKGIKPINYRWLVNKIKKHLPLLYNDLALNFYNPWADYCGRTKEYYILVSSATEYFIRK